MVLELVAGRILAPYIGVSIFSWTSVIGIVLGGISLGNYLGGRLADRWASSHSRGLRLLGTLLTLGGLSSLAILAVDVLRTFTYLTGLTLANAPLIAEDLAEDLRKTKDTIARHQRNLEKYQVDEQHINERFDGDITRFKKLKGID